MQVYASVHGVIVSVGCAHCRPSLHTCGWGVASVLWLQLTSQTIPEAGLADIRVTSYVTRVSGSEFQVLVFLFLIMSARDDGKLYLRFMVLSGLRMKEGMESFNLIIEPFKQNRLNEARALGF